jgi:hypothetical protein
LEIGDPAIFIEIKDRKINEFKDRVFAYQQQALLKEIRFPCSGLKIP